MQADERQHLLHWRAIQLAQQADNERFLASAGRAVEEQVGAVAIGNLHGAWC